MKLYPTSYLGKDYYINKKGDIYDFDSKLNISGMFSLEIRAIIMAQTFSGEINFDIRYRDGDATNINRENIYYELPENFETNLHLYGFRQIENFSRYYIAHNGVIYSTIKRIILHHRIKQGGYHIISLYDDNNDRQTILIHRLVYYNKVSSNEYHINHIDGRPWNNYVHNLEETTPLENTRHAINVINTRDSSWTIEEIHEICKKLEDGISSKEIYETINQIKPVSLNSIKELCHHLVYGTKFWKDVSTKYDFTKYIDGKYKYDDNTIHAVCGLLDQGVKPKLIEEETGVPLKYVCDIKYGNVRRPISKQYNFISSTTRES